MAEVSWQARRTQDSVLVDVTADIEGSVQGAPNPNPIEGGGGLANPVTEPLNIEVDGDTALVATSAGGEVTLGDTVAGGALLKVRGTSAFDGATIKVEDIDSADQYVVVNSVGSIHVRADEEQGSVRVTSEASSAYVEVAAEGDTRVVNISTIKGVSLTGITSAPTDGSLVAGEMVIWFDATNGAAKLMVKAKQADGTVRTGSVNLT